MPRAEAEPERSLEAGRAYLLNEQTTDGSWPDGEQPTAATGLALLALLAGELSEESDRQAVTRGITWLIARQRSNGQIGDNMEEHAAATIALAQMLLIGPPITDSGALREGLEKAVAFLMEAQTIRKTRDADQGGWHFQPTFPRSDLYYSGWQILALHAARQAGQTVDEKVHAAALGFVKRSRQREGYGAQPSFSEASDRAYRSHTGVALLAGRLLAPESDALEEKAVMTWLDAVPPTWGGTQYRGHFFGMTFFQSQAYRHFGQQSWENYRAQLFPLLLRHQRGDGHWEAPGTGTEEDTGGSVISTALAVLVLAVNERRLPIFWPRDIAMGLRKYN